MDRRSLLKIGAALPFLLGGGAVDALAETLAPLPSRRPKAGTAASGGTLAPPPLARVQKPLIVLDPGHGGRDPGAIGVNGTYEKIVTLDLAQRIAARIQAGGMCRCVLTRNRDVFVPLPDRAAKAQASGADMFISIHADSAPNGDARGLSVYTLAEKASDGLSAALADKENAADRLPGVPTDIADPEVAAILFDLTRRHSLNTALSRKAQIVRTAGKSLHLLENPKRSANFAVLRTPDVPSVLIETGFLSNPQDERLLASAATRATIANVLAQSFLAAISVA